MTSGTENGTAADRPREARAVMLLSLDRTRPFAHEMGLSVRGEFPWAECMRDFIREYRRAFYRDAPPHAPAESLPDVAEFTRVRLGADAGRALRWWLAHVYAEAPSDHPEYRAWEDVLRHARRRPAVWSHLDLPPRLAGRVRELFEEAIDPDRLEPIRERVRSQPLSDWDLHLYAVNAWNDDLPDAPVGPDLAIYLITRDYRNRVFWDALTRELTAEEQRAVHAAAQATVDVTPELAYVGALPPLAALGMEWP